MIDVSYAKGMPTTAMVKLLRYQTLWNITKNYLRNAPGKKGTV
jgi:hypothetical protein